MKKKERKERGADRWAQRAKLSFPSPNSI